MKENKKKFYLIQICEILQLNNIEEIINDFEKLKGNENGIDQKFKGLEDGFLEKNEIKKLEKYTFSYALNEFKKKYKDNKEKQLNIIQNLNPDYLFLL